MRLNLTLYTLTSLQFSPPGQNAWGKNQCENDDDKTVDHNERLRITGSRLAATMPGSADKIGRTCVVKDVEVKDGVFSIEEKQLTSCDRMTSTGAADRVEHFQRRDMLGDVVHPEQ